ncbi:TetR/AcrR family transcriptional regulator, partial [Kitasatospora sp. NPDC001574]
MAEVAAGVGITAPALYRHFRSKSELLDRAVRVGLDALAEGVRAAQQLLDAPGLLVGRADGGAGDEACGVGAAVDEPALGHRHQREGRGLDLEDAVGEVALDVDGPQGGEARDRVPHRGLVEHDVEAGGQVGGVRVGRVLVGQRDQLGGGDGEVVGGVLAGRVAGLQVADAEVDFAGGVLGNGGCLPVVGSAPADGRPGLFGGGAGS